jgi:hypothetical protein
MQHNNPYFNAVIEAHVLIQQWLAGHAPQAVCEQLLSRFSPRYSMVGIAGKALDYAGLTQFFRSSGGAKSGLEIEVFALHIISEWPNGAVVSYQEKQAQPGNPATLRHSTAVFERTAEGRIVWQRLHETAAG